MSRRCSRSDLQRQAEKQAACFAGKFDEIDAIHLLRVVFVVRKGNVPEIANFMPLRRFGFFEREKGWDGAVGMSSGRGNKNERKNRE